MRGQSDTSACRTNLLYDDPSQDDQFSSEEKLGPHSRVSNAIADLITKEQTNKATILGIEGEWGSGKSTVIQLLKSKISSVYTKLIIFDAWAHEGDPLRRTFIETIASELIKNESIPEKKWIDKLEILSRRKTTTTTRSSSTLTLLGKFFGLSILFIPLGARMLSEPLQGHIAINFHSPVFYQSIFGFLFSFLFLIVLLTNFALIAISKDKKISDPENWKFLAGDTKAVVVNDTQSTPEPTSLEFESIFKEMMGDALGSYPARKLIIVLDNLDRIESKDAQSIWSTLQTFINENSSLREQWASRLWFILPYDPKGLGKIWRIKTDLSPDPNALSNNSRYSPEEVEQSFFDKSFALRFEIPPPVLSNWKHFLGSMLEKALPEHKADSEIVYRIYNRHCREKSYNPTPRSIKIFINQIGAIHRQWHDDIPLGQIAYFVVLKKENLNIPKLLLTDKLPYSESVTDLDSTLRENLAGLYFNVDATLGKELLLTDPIFNALADSNATELSNLASVHKEGFWAILDQSYHSYLEGFTTGELTNSVVCLDNGELQKYANRSEFTRVTNFVHAKVESFPVWLPVNETIASALATVINRSGRRETAQKIGTSIRQGLISYDRATERPVPIGNILASVERLDHLVLDQFSDWIPESGFKVTEDIDTWFQICPELVKIGIKPRLLSNLKVGFSPEEIISRSINEISSGSPSEQLEDTIFVTYHAYKQLDFESAISASIDRFDPSFGIKLPEALQLIRLILKASSLGVPSAETHLKLMIEDGRISNTVNQPSLRESNEYIAIVILLHSKYRPDFSLPDNSVNSIVGHSHLMNILSEENSELACQVHDLLEEDERPGLLAEVIKHAGLNYLFLECFRLKFNSDGDSSTISVKRFISGWRQISEHFSAAKCSDRFEEFVTIYFDRFNLEETLIGGAFNRDHSEFYSFLLRDNRSLNKLREWCLSNLDSLPSDEWLEILSHDSATVELLAKASDQNLKLRTGTTFQDAIVSHSRLLLNPDESVDKSPEWSAGSIIKSLPEGSQIRLKERIIREVAAADGVITAIFVSVYGAEVNDENLLLKEERLLQEVLLPILEKQNADSVRWLSEISAKSPDFLSKVEDHHAVGELKRRVTSTLSAINEDSAIFCSLSKIGEDWRCGDMEYDPS